MGTKYKGEAQGSNSLPYNLSWFLRLLLLSSSRTFPIRNYMRSTALDEVPKDTSILPLLS